MEGLEGECGSAHEVVPVLNSIISRRRPLQTSRPLVRSSRDPRPLVRPFAARAGGWCGRARRRADDAASGDFSQLKKMVSEMQAQGMEMPRGMGGGLGGGPGGGRGALGGLDMGGLAEMMGGMQGADIGEMMQQGAAMFETMLDMPEVRPSFACCANYVYCTIGEVKFMMCHLVPDSPIPVPRNVVLSIHPLTVVKSSLSSTSGASTHTLSVPPSTDRLFVAVNLATAGTSHGVEDGQFEPPLSVLQVQYAGQTLPNTAYQSLNKSSTDRHVVKPFADFLAACGKLYLEQSSYGNMEEWSNNPIAGLSFEKAPNGSSTSVIVRCTRSATANNLVHGTASSAAAAANLVVCAQSHQAIVLTYGDDGLVSSRGSVVEL